MEKEIAFLGNAVNNPERPFVAILGGAKVSSKISVINNLLDKVDTLIIGGGMSYTFSKALGGHIGTSLCEDDYLQYALDMLKKAEEKAKQEKLIQEEKEKNKQRKESIDQADVMAQGYDYDGAIELLKSLDNYDKDADIVAKIAGGAKMFEVSGGSIGNIGQRNIDSVHLNLKKEGIRLLKEDVGGSVARTLLFDPSNGMACVRCYGRPELII